MAQINSYLALFGGKPLTAENAVQQARGRTPQLEERFSQQQPPPQQNLQSQRGSYKAAPLNVEPNEETLKTLVFNAQERQNQGHTVARGSILNLVV